MSHVLRCFLFSEMKRSIVNLWFWEGGGCSIAKCLLAYNSRAFRSSSLRILGTLLIPVCTILSPLTLLLICCSFNLCRRRFSADVQILWNPGPFPRGRWNAPLLIPWCFMMFWYFLMFLCVAPQIAKPNYWNLKLCRATRTWIFRSQEEQAAVCEVYAGDVGPLKMVWRFWKTQKIRANGGPKIDGSMCFC